MIKIPFITALKAHREAFRVKHKETIEKQIKSGYELKKHQLEKNDLDSDNIEFLNHCIKFIEIGENESVFNGYVKVLEKENDFYVSELIVKVKDILALKKMVRTTFEFVPKEKRKEINEIWTSRK